MAKLEDKVNEILGIESTPEATQPKEFQPPVERPKGDVEIKTHFISLLLQKKGTQNMERFDLFGRKSKKAIVSYIK